MRNRCSLFVVAAAIIFAAGCSHAQVPPTPHNATLSWTAPVPQSGETWQTPCGTSTGQSPCTYIVSRDVVTGSTCPAVNLTTPNYTPLNSASPASGTSYVDTTATGLRACYVVQTSQAGNVGSPSNTVGPLNVPANPGAPVTPSGTVAELQHAPQPPLPKPSIDARPVLTASVR